MIRAVIFDMDETLLDWSQHNGDWDEIRQSQLRPVYERLAARGHDLPPLKDVAELYNQVNHEVWMASTPPEWVAPRQIDVLRETLNRLKVVVGKEELAELQQLFGWGPIPGVRIFPDAPVVLAVLRRAGLRIGLMTNASSPMWMRDRELEAYGLLSFLDVRLTAGDVGHLKPHRRAFEAVLERLGVLPDEAIFVGDQLHDDVSGAQGVGMRAIWICRLRGDGVNGEGTDSHNGVKPHATIHTLTELLDKLDEWYPGWR